PDLLPVGAATDISLSSYPSQPLLYRFQPNGLPGPDQPRGLSGPRRSRSGRKYTAERAVREGDTCRESHARGTAVRTGPRPWPRRAPGEALRAAPRGGPPGPRRPSRPPGYGRRARALPVAGPAAVR